jgi:hypothetical protein
MKRYVLAYFAASLAALLLSDLALLLPTRSAVTLLLWIALGPVGPIGFASLGLWSMVGVWSWTWAIKVAFCYGIATAALTTCLWFAPRFDGIRKLLVIAAMVAVWLACAAYNLWFLSWSA